MHLFPYAAIISFLGFMEAISIAKAMAAKTGQRLDPNQELIGQGLANLHRRRRQKLPDLRFVFALGRQPAGRRRHGALERFHQPGGGHHAALPNAAAVPPAAVGAGGRHHDGGHRAAERLRLRARLESPAGRRDHFRHLVCQHAGRLRRTWTRAS
ncbi:MAG: SulP family inorganic anion transporter [Chromatiales bacterium]|nr:SulP family inorganic anion transporter [Chromatiales bacterium]